jgi:hypothetical protein
MTCTSAAERLDKLVTHELCPRDISKNQCEPSVRMRLMLRVTQCLEDLHADSYVHTDSVMRADPSVMQSVMQCRRLIEDARVQMHPELSASVMDAECALTEDTCYFMTVALCDSFMLRAPQEMCAWLGDDARACFNTGEGPSATYPYYLWQNIPASALTPIQLDDAFATLMQHSRDIDWEIWLHPDLGGLIRALHLRASQILTNHVYGGVSKSACDLYHDRRALWSCAVARLKLFALQTLQWRTHQQLRSANTRSASDGIASSTRTTAACVVEYLVKAVIAWNGPRLRESISKGHTLRILRPDEVGRNTAFEGSNSYCRARGTTDTMEDAMHKLDFVTLLQTPSSRCIGVIKLVRDLLMLKLLHNALEAISVCDLMHNHVQLQSLRDCRDLSQANISLYVHRLWELPSGFVVVPHCPWYPAGVLSLESAIALWYDNHFKGADPLGLHAEQRARHI